MEAHDAAIIVGGPMSANDDGDYIHREIDWIGLPLAADKPFLGVCLGAQMLARHLGHPRRASLGCLLRSHDGPSRSVISL